MIAIDEIDVGIARRAEQHGIARGIAGGGVSSGIAGSEVSFDFDDACRETNGVFAQQDFAEKGASYADRGAGEK